MTEMHARYLAKRLLLSLVSLYVIITILFLLFRLIPGDPAAAMTPPDYPPEAREALRDRFGLDEPLHIQYITYLSNLAQGDLGVSFAYGTSVADVLAIRVVNTLSLILTAIIISFLVGPLIGAYLSWHRGSRIDTFGIGAVLIMRSAPAFWTGMLALMVFSFWLGWLPAGGMTSPGGPSGWSRFFSIDFLRHLILPLTVTTLYFLSIPTFIMRNTMIDVLGADFIQLSYAQGIPESRILYRHALRNSLLPIFHYSAIAIGFAFGGSVVIETVFSWPGVGRTMWTAVINADYPLAQGSFIVLAAAIIFMNFLADVLSVYIDPRAAQGE